MRLNAALALIAASLIGAALWQLRAAEDGVLRTSVTIGDTPAIVYRPAAGGPHPVVVIAHGFAGSQQLMQSFALTCARNGYIAVTFDFPGHGRNPRPLTGSITEANGATQVLVASLQRVAAYARPLGDGRLAVLGHSMASDIVIRYAQSHPDVGATIAVSMFSPTVSADSPADLLVIVGDWESMLKREALRAIGLATAPQPAHAGTTYGNPEAGTGRRAAFSPHVEHVSVLYSQTSMREAISWLDRSFGVVRRAPPVLDGRGPWILCLLGGFVMLARPLATFLPRVTATPAGAGRSWRELWVPLIVPMLATPLILRVLPTHFLPVLVGDYLAVHFAMYGLITALCLALTRKAADARRAQPTTNPAAFAAGARPQQPTTRPTAFAAASIAVIAYGFVGLVWPVNEFITSFVPGRERLLLILVMLVGTLAFFLSNEWLTRGQGAARGAPAVASLCLLISLAIAVALDPYRLFFLIIIVPIMVLFLLMYGTFSGWIYRRTRHPWVAGVANAVAFAWAIGVTFPLLAG
jgi:pimeloyl-ACP methyl ester carboxylesterase